MDAVDDPYMTAREVEQDLTQMIEDPDLFLFDRHRPVPIPGPDLGAAAVDGAAAAAATTVDGDRQRQHELRFSPTKLHGRHREVSTLRDVCNRFLRASRSAAEAGAAGSVSASAGGDADSIGGGSAYSLSSRSTAGSLTGSTEIVLVSGPAGVGKSELVRRVVGPWLDEQSVENGTTGSSADGGDSDMGYLIEGKFDQLQGGRPYSAILDALAGLCEEISARGPGTTERMAATIREAVGTQGGVLTDVVPGLIGIIGTQPPVPEIKGIQAKNRFQYVFRKFFRAISQPDHPVVVFLDDLQWADIASLTLLKTIVTGTDSLIIGCYRCNEVNDDHPLAILMAKMETRGAPVTKINVGNISADAVNSLISDATGTYRRVTKPLADLVHVKSNGNTLFAVRVLETFREEGMLTYDAERYRWKWDEERIRERNIPDDVVELFSAKIQMLPTKTQEVMKVASGLGSRFDESTLFSIMDIMLKGQSEGGKRRFSLTKTSLPPVVECRQCLEALEKEGLIVRTSAPVATAWYKFSHDRIQQAAYSLTKEYDRSLFHLQIGNIMYDNAKASGKVKSNLFTIVDQLNRGISDIEAKDERIRLATLNLQAGEEAIKSSAFVPAVSYLRSGLDMLEEGERFVSDNCDIALRLFSAIAEAELVNCNFDEVNWASRQVFDHAPSLLDKFPCYMSLVKSQIAQGKVVDAISLGFDVLSQLGEPMPKAAGTVTILRDLTKTKLMLRGKTDVKICNLPAMEDQTKVAAMRMLSVMVSCCFYVKPEYIAPVTFRMVRLTLRYGLCNESPFGFATYGMILCGVLGDINGGYRFGQLSLSLVEKLDAKEWLARCYALVFYFIAFWRDPAKESLDKFLYASKIAMEVGDIEYAALQFVNYSGMAFQSGQPLEPLQHNMCDYDQVCTDLGQGMPQSILILWWQCVLNLMGQSDDPLVLTGTAMNEEKYLEEATAMGNSVGTHTLYFLRMLLAYTFGRFDLAAEYAEKSRNVIAQVVPGMLMVASHVFYDGLTACALARESKSKAERRKWVNVAGVSKKKMKRWASNSPSTFSHRYLLLKAERAAVKGEKRKACEAYDESIAVAGKNGFTQDQALANERAAQYFGHVSVQKTAFCYESNACQLYEAWGAKAKAEHLLAQQEQFKNACPTKQDASGLTWKSNSAGSVGVHVGLKKAT